jgi:hypothetical protein
MPSDDATPSALFLHCASVYAEMFRRSERRVADGVTEMVVYEGMLTKLVCEDLGLAVPYYTSVRRRLLDMGCIRQLKRGGGTAPSQWELIREPTADLWDELPQDTPVDGLDAQLLQMLADQGRRIDRVEKVLGIYGQPVME